MPPRTRNIRRVLVLVAATAIAVVGAIGTGLPAQAKPSPAELTKEIQSKNNLIELDAEKINGAQVQLSKDLKEQAKLAAQIGPLQLQASVADQQLGALAARIYMAGGPHATIEALFNASSTQSLIDELGAVNEMARNQKVAIDGASAQVAQFTAQKKKQDVLVAKEKVLVATLAANKKKVQGQLADLRKLQAQEKPPATKKSSGSGGGGGSSGGSGGGGGGTSFSHSYVTDGGKACPQTAGSGKGHIAAVKACSLLWPIHMYRINTSGPSTYDCSGLTMVAWRAAGVSLDHFTGDQIKSSETTAVSGGVSGLEVGDLVFYNSGHHVTIYVGNGMIVQAEETGQPVKMSPVTFSKIYAERRPIQ